MTKSSTDIDRKTASKLLRVSVRTIDRYIQSGKLLAHEENGRIWLNKRDVLDLPTRRFLPIRTSIDTKKSGNDVFYRDLYETSQHAIRDYQQKLEQTTYRIGQLESQILRPAVRSLEIRGQGIGDMDRGLEFTKKELGDREKEIVALRELARKERVSRIIFAVITYILLILQPIFWYLLR